MSPRTPRCARERLAVHIPRRRAPAPLSSGTPARPLTRTRGHAPRAAVGWSDSLLDSSGGLVRGAGRLNPERWPSPFGGLDGPLCQAADVQRAGAPSLPPGAAGSSTYARYA
ncbi:hypothetical protein BC628DRAFT_865049 [Trametes gibbosa]|nr:hypothetical protein BC628DRAFT_865049 [Trametes gibbosa]